MNLHERVRLARDCEMIQIPMGTPITLPAGAEVIITQALGGTYTVTTEQGFLARIAAEDADALGKETPPAPDANAQRGGEAGKDLEEQVWDQLRTCYDPEIPVNIVDLGLVYHCEVVPLPEGVNKVEVKFTLTAPGCGMGGVLKADAEGKIRRLPGVADVNVEIVFEPMWNPNMMSEAARLQLGML
jgi:probable FeS assembly SUF system protein SufT